MCNFLTDNTIFEHGLEIRCMLKDKNLKLINADQPIEEFGYVYWVIHNRSQRSRKDLEVLAQIRDSRIYWDQEEKGVTTLTHEATFTLSVPKGDLEVISKKFIVRNTGAERITSRCRCGGLLGGFRPPLELSINFEVGTASQDGPPIIFQSEGVVMGDIINYNQGQGVQGHNVHAHHMTFNQAWNQADRKVLVNEFEKLLIELKKKATDSEHYVEIGAVAKAKIEAEKNDKGGVFSALTNVGKWTLEIAEKIGVDTVVALIKAALLGGS